MDLSVLKTLNEARAALTPIGLVTHLENGRQWLVTRDGCEGDLSPALIDAVQSALDDDKSQVIDEAYFVQVHNPPLRLVVVGAVHIAQALAPMAATAGYAVTVVDPRGAFATDERFPGVTVSQDWPDEALADFALDHRSAVVTLTHDPKLDDAALEVALNSEAFYIGCLGSKKTHLARTKRMARLGFDEPVISRIHGPVGLAIGAKSPAEIAVAILAQIIECRRRPARHVEAQGQAA